MRPQSVARLLAETGALRPQPGSHSGYCIVCGEWTDHGHTIRETFSDNFTEYNKLPGSRLKPGVVCEYCYALAKAKEYRRKSWVATRRGVEFLDRGRLLEVLLEPPKPPFYIYATRSGKKAGFLAWPFTQWSRHRFTIVVDGERILVDVDRAKKLADLARQAKAARLTKTEMLQGCSPRRWEHREMCMEIERVKRDPLWRVIVWLV